MSEANRRMILNLVLSNAGSHRGAWRHPDTELDCIHDLKHFLRLARKAEAARLDSLFIADGLSIEVKAVQHGPIFGFEPLTLLSSIAAVTERIGLIATVSTSFTEPYNLARSFASLDHISGGRAGWNMVTTGVDRTAANFGLEHLPSHTERYEKAREFAEVVLKLWNSWEKDSLVQDRASGVYADADKVHDIRHEGKYFSVRGALNIMRSPQGRPLLVQAGSSEEGKALAAQYAELIFTIQRTFEEGRQFYDDIKSRTVQAGRSPDSLKVLPGLHVIVGATEEEAKKKADQLRELTSVERSLMSMSNMLGIDFSAFPLDAPFPQLPEPGEANAYQTFHRMIKAVVDRQPVTIREVLEKYWVGTGELNIAGTPEQVADVMEYWFRNSAADGFNVMPQLTFGDTDLFLDLVVPELQRRGLFPETYTGQTLRENLGLEPI
ncbi:LLM class flavin-dependent oxidoreductase [Paenibacillus hemerocallicola]|uniref:LLM class flavin-dependent oxidoreductase n=1 Tax=Paenibacillus hemerocallicola TaxID=1172614 RepID=A0A5C4TEL1_9BACL|nr:LLM class flavin-dependent oxidoreductase [Paenibacillus hemerocallicola]TNJ66967.1 LLM class flavin-dependent oxidoreductase [Paenibacillus hemerocallicola]